MSRPQVFLMHFAGGNCYSLQFLSPFLKEFDLVYPELPGRGRRMMERLLKNFDAAALDMYEQVARQLTGGDIILYGHSMGAYLAFRVAALLARDGLHAASLIVSGNPGPGVRECRNRYLMQQEDLMQELKKMGGTQEELMNDRDLFSFFEPILRADFEIAEKNELAFDAPVNTPLYAIMGDQEEDTEKIFHWGRFTKSSFDYELLDGDHFFIYKHAQRLANIIRYCYGKAKRNAFTNVNNYTH